MSWLYCLWRVLVSSVIGAILGLMLFVPKVNGSGMDDIRGTFSGAFLGVIAGALWHHLKAPAAPPAPNSKTPDSN